MRISRHLGQHPTVMSESSLNREILLRIGDLADAGITVHRNHVAGVTAEKPILNFSLRPTAEGHHFRCGAKLVIRIHATVIE